MKYLELNKNVSHQQRSRTKEKQHLSGFELPKKSISPQNKINPAYKSKQLSEVKQSVFMQIGSDMLTKNTPDFKSKNNLNYQELALIKKINVNDNNVFNKIRQIVMKNDKDQGFNQDKDKFVNLINFKNFNSLNPYSSSQNSKNIEINNDFDSLLNNNENQRDHSVSPPKAIKLINNTSQKKEDDELIKISLNEAYMNNLFLVVDVLLDLNYSFESKQGIQANNKKYLSCLKDNLAGNFNFEVFENQNLNKLLQKSVKITMIMCICVKFALCEFQFDHNLKTSLKKMFNSISEVISCIIDAFIINNSYYSSNELLNDIKDKVIRVSKSLKINKKNSSDLISNLNRLSDSSINVVKTFSSTYFKNGFMKPIHTIIFDLFRILEKITTSKLISVTLENVLFNYLNNNHQLNNNFLTNKMVLMGGPNIFNYIFASPTAPFLSNTSTNILGYTLVLDLDETLVHFFFTPSGGVYLIRPFAIDFLKNLSSLYEIIIFTAAMKDYADTILDQIDPDKILIKHRLYRNHTTITPNGFVKDISKIGRDLSKMIIIDNLPENFKLQPYNGLAIRTWNEDMKDTQLIDLYKILKDLVTLKVSDVRIIVRKIKEEINKNQKNSMNPYSTIDISRFLA